MNRCGKKLLSLFFLLIVFSVTVSIDLFHTEMPGHQTSDSCPACGFHDSSIAVVHVARFELPTFALVGILHCISFKEYEVSFSEPVDSTSEPTFVLLGTLNISTFGEYEAFLPKGVLARSPPEL